jgi:phytoene/squalene synthetase
MHFQVDRAQELFESGASLPSTLNRRLAVDIELFRQGGLAVLEGIRKNGYNVLEHRPVVSKKQQIRLFLHCLFARY